MNLTALDTDLAVLDIIVAVFDIQINGQNYCDNNLHSHFISKNALDYFENLKY